MPALSNQRLADKIIFGESHKQNTLVNLLTQDASSITTAFDKDEAVQSKPSAPVVQINDLKKTHGNNVNVTIRHDLTEMPSMGIDDRDGFEEDISTSNFQVLIDQYHKSTKVPLMIEQQKVGYNKKKLGRPALITYQAQIVDEIGIVQICGDRGTQTGGRILPLASHVKFDGLMVNEVKAPTFDRKIYCGDAESIDGTTGDAMTSTDSFSPSDTRRFKEAIELMEHPLIPCAVGAGDKSPGTDPMYLGFVTPKMWTTFEASDGFQALVGNALTRTKGFNHPLFQGEMFMKDNILFRKYLKPVGWSAGDEITVSDDADSATTHTETAPAGFNIERGFVLGGQALAIAYGSVLPGGQGNFKMDGEMYQQNAWYRQWMDWIMGCAKVRAADSTGRVNDFGVLVFDAAVPS